MTRALSTQPTAPSATNNSARHLLETSKTNKVLVDGCSLVAFLLPIKLSLTYIALTPLILCWAYFNRHGIISRDLPRGAQRIAAPLLAFLAVVTFSSGAGISPMHSIRALSSLLFFSLTIPLFARYARPHQVCIALIAGQSLAALHSFLDGAIPETLPRFFLGKVTESGQLAITIPLALGLLAGGFQRSLLTSHPQKNTERYLLPLLALAITAFLTLLGFHSDLALPSSIRTSALLALVVSVLCTWRTLTTHVQKVQQHHILLVASLPLLTSALLINLKRGPWLGVLVGTACLLLVYARRLILPLTIGSIILAGSVTPIRDRLLASYDHFTIEGGRSTIWRIGAELVAEYPLGIGYHNSGILREFAPEIPSELKHFHNNILNITAEAGWLGITLFSWLIIATLRSCFQDRSAPLYVAIGSAIISWQVAGIVEYNFGDSEVTIVIWILLGLLIQREISADSLPENTR